MISADYVISGIYSPVNPDQELQVGEILRQSITNVSITYSHQIGHMGLLERENAAILNESLKTLCSKTLSGLKTALNDIGVNCPIFLTKNDGTLTR